MTSFIEPNSNNLVTGTVVTDTVKTGTVVNNETSSDSCCSCITDLFARVMSKLSQLSDPLPIDQAWGLAENVIANLNTFEVTLNKGEKLPGGYLPFVDNILNEIHNLSKFCVDNHFDTTQLGWLLARSKEGMQPILAAAEQTYKENPSKTSGNVLTLLNYYTGLLYKDFKTAVN